MKGNTAMIDPDIGRQVRVKQGHGVLDMHRGWIEEIDGASVRVSFIDPSDEFISTYVIHTAVEFEDRPMCKGDISLGTGCRKCQRCYEQVEEGITRFQPSPEDHDLPQMPDDYLSSLPQELRDSIAAADLIDPTKPIGPQLASKTRKMHPIPVAAGERIAKDYGYDQVVILARRVGEDPDPNGEHITTYGIDPTHCDVAALMGKKLKDIAGWPERTDFALALDLVHDLVHDFEKNEDNDIRLPALRRILERKA